MNKNITFANLNKAYHARANLVGEMVFTLTGAEVDELWLDHHTDRIDLFLTVPRGSAMFNDGDGEEERNKTFVPLVREYLKEEGVRSLVVHWHYSISGSFSICDCCNREIIL